MNPASAASAVEMSAGFSGIAVALIVLLVIIVVILALALVKHRSPAAEAKSIVTDLRNEAAKLEPAAEQAVTKLELGVDKDLSTLLATAETKLLDTTGEDAAIAAAQTYLAKVTAEVQTSVAAATAQKQAKLAALQAHVATLQAAVTPATGS